MNGLALIRAIDWRAIALALAASKLECTGGLGNAESYYAPSVIRDALDYSAPAFATTRSSERPRLATILSAADNVSGPLGPTSYPIRRNGTAGETESGGSSARCRWGRTEPLRVVANPLCYASRGLRVKRSRSCRQTVEISTIASQYLITTLRRWPRLQAIWLSSWAI